MGFEHEIRLWRRWQSLRTPKVVTDEPRRRSLAGIEAAAETLAQGSTRAHENRTEERCRQSAAGAEDRWRSVGERACAEVAGDGEWGGGRRRRLLGFE
jgi:hypothetical protein